jgi:hypothetical protein
MSDERLGRGDNIPMALLGWVTGCTLIWAALFTVGNYLYGRINYALVLLAICVVSGGILLQVVRTLWSDQTPLDPLVLDAARSIH